MGKIKKTDLKKVVKKAEREARKNPVSDFKEHLTKPIIEPKNKRKKQKERIGDVKKTAGKKGQGKPGVKKTPGKVDDKTNKGKNGKRGNKTELPRATEQGEKRHILDRILPPWF